MKTNQNLRRLGEKKQYQPLLPVLAERADGNRHLIESGGGPRTLWAVKPSGMTYCNTNAASGFTLIELLVVVLIIGILAGVALPQYQTAVMKARFAKLYSILRTYKNAADVYVTENGEWPVTFDDLVVTAPEGMTKKTAGYNDCVQNNEFYCCMAPTVAGMQSSGITCGLTDYSLAYEYQYDTASESKQDRYYCEAKKENNSAKKVCMGYGEIRSEQAIISPAGYQDGYYFYTM